MSPTVAGTTPYAWPWDGALDPARLALVVLTPRAPDQGRSPDLGLWDVVRVTSGRVRAAGGAVVQVTTAPPSRAGAGRVGSTFLDAGHRIDAVGTDGFYGSGLDDLLRRQRRDQLVLAGAWLETSVHSTMRSANDRGYECLLVLDACEAYDASLVAASRSQIEMSGGIFGAVGSAADLHTAITPL